MYPIVSPLDIIQFRISDCEALLLRLVFVRWFVGS
jgi:hypothetical protein